jgi:hypothetical protein
MDRWHTPCFIPIEIIIHIGVAEMSHNIASKLAAVAIAVVMNGIVLGGICYLFDSPAYAAPTFAHSQSDTTHLPAAVV